MYLFHVMETNQDGHRQIVALRTGPALERVHGYGDDLGNGTVYRLQKAPLLLVTADGLE